MKQLNVVIAGQAGSGKTTLAKEIYNTLFAAGFNVEMKDDDDYGNVIKNEEDFNKRRKAVMTDKTKIKIATATISRSQLV